jgi:cyd operon protein YbgT
MKTRSSTEKRHFRLIERIWKMWYFAWILGVLLAAAFGIINVMWMEAEEMLGSENDRQQPG